MATSLSTYPVLSLAVGAAGQATASSEAVRLAAAREVLAIALARRPGVDYVSGAELRTIVERVLALALDSMPDQEQQDNFILAFAEFRDSL